MRGLAEIVGAVGVTLLLAGGPALAQQEPTTLRINWSMTEAHSYSLALQEWAAAVTEGTNGTVTFDLYYQDALGPQRESLDNIRLGALDGTFSFELFSQWVPEVDVVSTGYLFKDEDHLRRALEGPLGERIEEKLIAAGFRPMMYFYRAPRNITSNKPIETLDDLAGMKIRVPQSPASIDLFRALGANPTPLPFPDIIPGLESGVIDGQENPFDQVADYQFWDVQKYAAVTEHQRQVLIFVISERTYQKLTDETKQVMHEAAAVAQANEYARFKAQEKQIEELLRENGMIFTYPDQAEFREAASAVFSSLSPVAQEVVELIRAVE